MYGNNLLLTGYVLIFCLCLSLSICLSLPASNPGPHACWASALPLKPHASPLSLFKNINRTQVVANHFNPSTQEPEAGRSLSSSPAWSIE
ncbi:rCG28442 [Rattus norvegicus]|uniref:RCG28442 n=1 Tax=Rattus norvegicus TaxID=10116 RepID=A6HWN3_RAT|nr:rCG28442 [Rattus norvegicus]